MALKENDCADPQQVQWVIMETRNDICDDFLLESSESSIEDSENSAGTSSIDMVEDDASSSYGPLYELSELMAQLPIKRRGLSKFYQGKSQSFGHLGTVNSHTDLAKKESSYNSRMKSCQSFGGGFSRISSFGPKASITKKSSRMTILSSSLIDTNTLVGICRFPTTLEKKF